jgi:hypothetical protein
MPTPVSGLPISFSDIQTEFGGENPIGIEEYYQNAAISYTSGVAGIPSVVGAAISIDMFYGKSKPAAPPSSYPPAAVESSRANLGNPWPFGNTSYEWLTGASGTNLTRSGGTTFNNIGAYARYRGNDANNQSLILQAKPGDALRFVLNNGVSANYSNEINSLWLHLGAGWFLVQSIKLNGSHTDTIDYTLSASLAPGNYGIYAYNNYSSAGSSSYASGNFYSLHVVA